MLTVFCIFNPGKEEREEIGWSTMQVKSLPCPYFTQTLMRGQEK
jgi:hypothetical protein